MNKKIILLIVFLVSGFLSFSQEKQLTLEDAVLGDYNSFYPSGLSGLQWIKNSNAVSWLSDDYQRLIRYDLSTGITDTILNLEDINSALDLDLKNIRNPKWLDQSHFYFANGDHYYQFDFIQKTGKTWLEIPEGENMVFNLKAESFAFTVENNLFLKQRNDKPFAITDFKDKNIVAGQAIARHEFGINNGIFWSPDGTAVAFYQKDESEVTDYPILDITTTPGTLREEKYPMAGQASEFASVGVFDLETQKIVYLKVEGPRDQYLTNLGWGPDSRYIYIAVLNREQNHMQLNKYDSMNGKQVKTLFEEKHPKYVEPEQPVRFIPGSNRDFLWFSERDGFNHIYRYNDKGELLNQVTAGKWEAQEIIGFDEDTEHVFVFGTDESGLNRYLYKASLTNEKANSLSAVPGMHRFTLSDDKRFLIDRYSSSQIPGKIDILDANGMVIRNLHTAENPLKDYKMGVAELIDLQAEDGTILHARLIRPYDFTPEKKYPVLTYVYGGPHLQLITNSWLMNAQLWMYYFADKGYLVFTLDNRGSANRGLEFENIIHRQLGEIEIRDQLKGVDYLKSLPYVDSTRMAIDGWSFGGFMATSLMLKTPGVYKAAVAGGPVTDWKYYEVMYGERYMDTPEENPEGYELTSLLNKAGNLEGELLLIHGTADNTVVMQQNLSLIREFVEEGKQVEFFPYPMHPHNVRGRDRLHLMQKILDFVEEKIGD